MMATFGAKTSEGIWPCCTVVTLAFVNGYVRSGLVTVAPKSIRKLAQKVTPALLVTSSVLVIRQVLVTKSQEGVLALFLKSHGHKRFEPARMERHPRVLDLRWTIEDGEAPVMGLLLASLVDKQPVKKAVHFGVENKLGG